MRIITYKTRYTGTYIYVPVPGTILSHVFLIKMMTFIKTIQCSNSSRNSLLSSFVTVRFRTKFKNHAIFFLARKCTLRRDSIKH